MNTPHSQLTAGKTGLYAAIRPLLNQLHSPYPTTIRLQESTILAIVWNVILTGGFDRDEFWQRPDTSSRASYKKWRKDDPDFVRVLDACIDTGWNWSLESTATAVQDALAIIQLAAPEAAQQMINLMLTAENESNRLKAAADILNRISETAEKGQAQVALSVDALHSLRLAAQDDLATWEQEHLADGVET